MADRDALVAESTLSVERALRDAMERFVCASDSPRADAIELLNHCCGLDRTALLTGGDRQLDAIQRSRFASACKRRLQGEPIAYITRERGFWSLLLEVSRDTLIPRPDTETLVESALDCIPTDTCSRCLDLGTGTGAIAISIAKERANCQVLATDFDEHALAVARRNAVRNKVSVTFRQGSWFDALDKHAARFEIIVSNPPYVATNDPHLKRGDLRFEPQHALVSGPDGLDALRHIIHTAGRWLRPGGWLLVEHGFEQGSSVRSLFESAGFNTIDTLRDLAANDRVTRGRWVVAA